MSKKMLVTSDQTDKVRDMAKEKGITRAEFQAAQDDGRIARFLDTLRVDVKNVDLATLTPPPGARLHTVRISFKPDREWQEAINAVGPNTPSDHNVRKVGDQYPLTGTKEIEEDLILLNFHNGGGFEDALVWAASNQLQNTVSREVFAIGEQHPKLYEKLGQNLMYVVATKECTFGGDRSACYVWWNGSRRKANLNWVKNFDNSNDWFAFRNFFISLLSIIFFGGRVLFCELTYPPAKHFSDLLYFYRQSNILLIFQGFCFPEDHEKNTKSI